MVGRTASYHCGCTVGRVHEVSQTTILVMRLGVDVCIGHISVVVCLLFFLMVVGIKTKGNRRHTVGRTLLQLVYGQLMHGEARLVVSLSYVLTASSQQ